MNKELRIIAGKFRGRKIIFSDQNVKLRPTMDRVRETLFNWLAPYIVGADCLDLFAGSGVFSFEAISRGANFSLAVEYNYDTYHNIIQNRNKLEIKQQIFHIIHQDVLLFLNNNLQYRKFNIIFLDPPYNQHKEMLLESLYGLINNNLLQPNSKIYFECNTNDHILKESNFPKNLQIIKSSKAGKVYFYLVEYLCSTKI